LAEWIDEQVAQQRQDNPDFDPDFYSEREWLDLYEDALGLDRPALPAPATAAAHASATARDEDDGLPGDGGSAPELADQLAALRKLEAGLARLPAETDACSAWLTNTVCVSLRTVGVVTLRNLVDYINMYGFRWFRRVPGIGPVLAQRLVQWLMPVATEHLRTALKARALLPAHVLTLQTKATHVPRFGMVPLTMLRVPPALDGHDGEFRISGPNTFAARTDLEAINSWLARYGRSPRTFASYGRALEVFYLYCLLHVRKPLSSVVEGDVQAFAQFLAKPEPGWVQVGTVVRGHEDWRPLRGPQSGRSIRHALSVVSSMYRGLMQANYLSANPAAGVVPLLRLPAPKLDRRRSFTTTQWALLTRTLAAMPSTPTLRRAQWVLALASTTGMRLVEMTTTRTSALRRERFDDNEVVLLDVLGKGNRERVVVIAEEDLALMRAHHEDMERLGTHFDPNVKTMRTLNGDVPTTVEEDQLDAHGLRPLVGALQRTPARWSVDPQTLKRTLEGNRPLADRFGALEPSALYQSLKRVFRAARDEAVATGDLVDQADAEAFGRASTHWLRHYCANAMAADDVPATVMRDVLGHADLKTTSVYLQSETKQIVRELAKARAKRLSKI
jgi:site-specific recombinase XerD